LASKYNHNLKVLHLLAPAKVNLILRVVSKRDDGYHELETWMQKIGLYDRITVGIHDSPGITLTCNSPDVPTDETNLIWRAADTFLKNSRNAQKTGVSIELQKNIPVSAGLGGGSSDAGTLLKGLNDYFGEEFSPADLIKMGKSLGADVPFFVVNDKSVLATGIGDKMLPVEPLAKCTFILVNPGIHVSTASIFEKFALTRADKNSTLTGFRKIHPEDLTLSALENDLEKVTIRLFPVIKEVKEKLKSAGADAVLMSGSGPTVFGVFAGSPHSTDSIKNTVSDLRQRYGDKVYIAD
jgi:4-diphosphocytidyl-2-C-methyl-D-erythritol kinase